ncbi:MAG: acetylglutamate kinase [Sulfurospirillaceae bacterium]|nr:acetylglutamate kinase [Sulfurospirillaceae bacterium]MCK9545996.1 acetylglutamate kinase [Sulfurospirillaceae bacterium]NLM98497.1 acetylglutamate kinase [Campylobacteraceae bacterium]
MRRKIETAKTILMALPYIKRFTKKIIVIKYGGAAQINPTLKDRFVQDLVLLYLVGIKPVIVHGGGKKISELLEKLELGTNFVDGLRVTDEKVMEVVEMVLSGNINKEITALLNYHGAKAIGITGKDANFMRATPLANGKYGLVGDICDIKSSVLLKLIDDSFIPVIAPIAAGDSATHPGFNINADLAASKIAISLKAEKVLFLTDTKGVLDKDKNLISTLTVDKIKELKADGTIHGGMLPKVDACLEAVNGGVNKAHIIDGRVEHSILLELFTDEGIGTVFKK